MKIISYFIFFLFFSVKTFAQTNVNDDIILLKSTYQAFSENKKHITLLQPKHSVIINYINPLFLAFKGMMAFYQHALSPQISAECVYKESCSNFSKSAIHEHGLLMGILLSSDRLMRCNGKASVEYPDFLFDTTCDKIIDEASFYSFH